MELLLEAQMVANAVKNLLPLMESESLCNEPHLSKELYCNCTLHRICIIHSCAATVYYALRGGGGCSQ